MIYLSDDNLIAKGSERACYQHPEHSDLCIKIRYNIKRKRDENTSEYNYIKKMKFAIDSAPVSFPIEWVNTNLGKGLVFPLIKDHTGSISKTVSSSYIEKSIDKESLLPLYLDFKRKMVEQNIAVTDPKPQNIVIKKINEQISTLILIDGFGQSNLINIPYFLKRQTARRITRSFEKLFRSSK